MIDRPYFDFGDFGLVKKSELIGFWRWVTYLYPVVALLVYDGHVTPSYVQHDVHHCFHLIVIARNGAREVLEALFVGQFRAGREEGDLQEIGSYFSGNLETLRTLYYKIFIFISQKIVVKAIIFNNLDKCKVILFGLY